MGRTRLLGRNGQVLAEWEADRQQAIELMTELASDAVGMVFLTGGHVEIQFTPPSRQGPAQAEAKTPKTKPEGPRSSARAPLFEDDSAEAGVIAKYAQAIEDRILKLTGDRRHTSADIQAWTVGRQLTNEDRTERSSVDRARRKAHEKLGPELGGTFEKGGKEGRTAVYVLRPR